MSSWARFVLCVFACGFCLPACDAIVGVRCGSGYRAADGGCVVSVDAGFEDGSTDGSLSDGAMADGSMGDGGSDGSMVDGSLSGCGLGEKDCGGTCADVLNDPNNCGDCGTMCTGGAPVCAGGMCIASCSMPFSMCGPECVDTSVNPNHCGMCGNVCPASLCTGGGCVAASGHAVLVGHDYSGTTNNTMEVIAHNSVFLSLGVPYTVLAYEGTASTASVTGVDTAINNVAMSSGRSWTKVVATAGQVTSQLLLARAFVIYPQGDSSTDMELQMLAADWAASLASFLQRGGVVVLFDGPATHAGTWQLLSGTGLVSIAGTTDVGGNSLTVDVLGDAVVTGASSGTYTAEAGSVRFDSSDSTQVVGDGSGPVVIHRVFAQ